MIFNKNQRLTFSIISISVTFVTLILIFNNQPAIGYNLNKPKTILTLPDTLHEISGITVIDDSTIACIEDENGILFIYNLYNNSIVKQYRFGTDGDYEGICRAGSNLYILRSDGTLFEISDFASLEFKVRMFYPDVPAYNNEGLCYDEANNQLLIGCKSNPEKGHKTKDLRVIYGFNLETKKLTHKPLFKFHLDDVKEFVANSNLKIKRKKDQFDPSDIKLRISDLAIHPKNDLFYMLSSVDHLLLVFNRSGQLLQVSALDHKLFRQPEGIAFLPNCDMLISNEADNKQPTLLRFKYKKK